MEQLNDIGLKIFVVISEGSYYFFGAITLIDIFKKFSQRDVEGCIKSLLNGGIGFACIYGVTIVLDMVKSTFK